MLIDDPPQADAAVTLIFASHLGTAHRSIHKSVFCIEDHTEGTPKWQRNPRLNNTLWDN